MLWEADAGDNKQVTHYVAQLLVSYQKSHTTDIGGGSNFPDVDSAWL